MPPQDIMQGMPIAIMAFMALQRSCIIAMPDPSMGVMVQTMPSLVISQLIRHIIGIAIIGMPPIIPMPPIGMPPIIGIPMPPMGMPIPPIIGFMPFIIIGIGMGMGIIIGIPADDGFIPLPIIGIALIGVIVGLLVPAPAGPVHLRAGQSGANAVSAQRAFSSASMDARPRS